ncbi:MAG: hypothetical protein U5K69_18810 [Balneolaceae bacterium]|nr:hypothetical protein [Balneolaceae bacterium]
MTKIGILTFQNGYKRGATDFYPLIKWDKLFKEEGMNIQFFSSHKNKKIIVQDVVIIDFRYYRTLTVHKDIYPDNEFIIRIYSCTKKK